MSADKLQIVKRIASGGMAELFLARQQGLSGVEKLVVVKQVLPQYHRKPEFVRMFEDEARINALLQHPNLVQMFELGNRDGMPFLTLEFLHGEDVRGIYRALRERGASMKLTHAINIVIGVCAGLHYAHELRGLDGQMLNVVHRDISPQNVVVTFSGGVKVVDFGIARADNRRNETRSSVLKGKIAYMAPEQIRNDKIDRRADVYAVGVLLYEMTTGQRPYRSGHEVALMRAVLEDEVPPPRKVLPGYPPPLEAIVLRALQKDPKARYQSAQELQSALEEFARSTGLLLSNVPLSKFMGELFGDREDLYRQVLAGTRSVDELNLEAQIGGATETPEPDSGESSAPGALSPLHAAPVDESLPIPEPVAEGEHYEVERLGEVQIVRLSGKLNEKFAGAALARVLKGAVVMDVSKVERVTSFGVREWLQFLSAIETAVAPLYYVGCSEAFVNQLSMVRRFMGPGEVLSFQAPHHCRTCDRLVPLLVDVATHATVLAKPALPPCTCPGCGRPADFDDDVSAYLAFGPKPPARPLAPAIARVVRWLNDRAADVKSGGEPKAESIEKVLEPTCTRIRVKGIMTAGARWSKVFDGLEGDVVLDLTQVESHGDTAVRELTRALSDLGPETTSLKVLGARPPMATALAAVGKAKVESIMLDAPCTRCGDARPRLVELPLQAPVKCSACGVELDVGPLDWLQKSAPATVSPPVPAPEPVAAPVVTPATSSSPRALFIVIATALGGLLLGALGLHFWPAPRPVGPMGEGPSGDASTEVPSTLPAWALAPASLQREATKWVLLARGQGADAEHATQAAQAFAAHELALAFEESSSPLAHSVLKQARAHANTPGARVEPPPPTERAIAHTPQGVEVALRFELPTEQVTQLTGQVTRETHWRGVTFLTAPRDLAAAGGLLVLASDDGSPGLQAGLRPGDLALEFNGLAIHSVDDFDREVAPLADKPVTVKVLAAGVSRSLHVGP